MIIRFLLRFFYSFSFFALEAPERPTSIDLRDAATAAGDKLRELRALPADKRGDTYDTDLRAASALVVDLDREFNEARNREQYDFELLAMERGLALPEARGGHASGQQVTDSDEYRTPGDIVVNSEQFKEMRDGRMGEVEVRNLIAAGTPGSGSGSTAFTPVGTPYLAPQSIQQRRLFIRDVLSVQQTNLASVPYVQERLASTYETGATTVSEGSAKPEVTMQFTVADAPIRKIAAWIQVTMEALQDAPTLAGYINNRLAYMVLLEEEEQVLSGNGTAPNLTGVTQVTGKQTQAATNNDVPGTIADAIALVENVDGYPDGIAMNPGDYWASVSERRSTVFDGALSGPGGFAPFGAPAPTLWGLPIVRTRSLSTLTAVVGSWRLGATLFQREGVTIRSTDSHASLFVSNTSVVLAEERVGLAIHRPDWFVVTTLDITA